MGAKVLSASLSILWLALLHGPAASMPGYSGPGFLKTQPAFGAEVSPARACQECVLLDGDPLEASTFVPFSPSHAGIAWQPAGLSSAGARAYLFRTGLSPPARG